MDYIVNTFIPMLQKAKAAAVDPIVKAFNDNREALEDLWAFTKNYIVPIFEFTLVKAIENVGKAIAGILNIIGSVVEGIKSIVRTAIENINSFINLVNKLPCVNLQTLGVPSFAQSNQTTGRILSSTGSINIPAPFTPSGTTSTGGTVLGGSTTRSNTSNIPVTAATSAAKESAKVVAEAIADLTPKFPSSPAEFRAFESGDVINTGGIPSTFDVARVRAAEAGITINVNAPSIIDEEAYTRATINAFNQVQARTGGGASQLVL